VYETALERAVFMRSQLQRYHGLTLGAFQGNYTVTLIEGDGIGPEISQSVKDIFSAAKVPVEWEPVDVTPRLVDGKTTIPTESIESVKRNLVALKGPLAVGHAGQQAAISDN
jgi:isocitrate dehydrogenase (NAD+)